MKASINCLARSSIVFLALCAVAVNWRAAAAGPDQEKKPVQEEKPAELAHKNIQVLKGLPESQFFGVMRFMAASLGVNCNHCHVEGTTTENWPWEKDDKETKRTARKMILMMRNINQENFGGRQIVNCSTCHQGNPKPVSAPPVGQDVLRRLHAQPAADARPAEPLPTVDQVLDKYVQAAGGKAAFERLKNRVMKAELVLSTGRTIPQEIYRQAPNKALVITTGPSGVITQGFNGTIGWVKTSEGVQQLNSFAVADFKFNADFNREIRVRELYRNLSVAGKEKVGNHEAYIVEAIPLEGAAEKLYFDAQTGLLIRRAADEVTVFGTIPDYTDMEDYKDVDGVKLPFTVRRVSQWSNGTLRVVEVKHNVEIDDAKFEMPRAK